VLLGSIVEELLAKHQVLEATGKNADFNPLLTSTKVQ
jgi:hypothetical protein